MSGAGTQARERFFRNMAQISVGAQLARRHVWTVVKQRHFDTSVDLTLRRGRRTVRVSVPVSLHGPDLFDVGLRPMAAAPVQRDLLGMGVAA